jgi:aspartate/methionine/tyrosine aminotransferase
MTQAMRESCDARRERLVGGLRRLGFGIERDPEGAFYVLADARRFGADSRALAFDLLERAHVGTTPGIDFGPAAEGRLRFCYAVRPETIDTALERLEPVLRELESGGAASAPDTARGRAR